MDTIKALFAHGTASVLVLGGTFAIVFIDMQPDKLAIVAGLVGGAAAFLYGQEAATRATRAAAAIQAGNGVPH